MMYSVDISHKNLRSFKNIYKLKLSGEDQLPVNQMETQLEAITTTIAYLEKHKSCDPKVIEQLKMERERLLRELNVHRI